MPFFKYLYLQKHKSYTHFMETKHFYCFIAIAIVMLMARYVLAGEIIPQELYINSKGEAYFSGAELISKHALNLFTVRIWGQNWEVVTDYTTSFVSNFGATINTAEILTGHFLEVKGRPVPDNVGRMEATIVKDISIKTGTSSVQTTLGTTAASNTQISGIAPFLGSQSNLSSAASRLTQYLRLGMRGGEVGLLQKFLQKNNLGIPNDGPVTGFFGKVTEKAVMKFQETNNLEATGTVGPKTRSLINPMLIQ